MQLDVLVAVVKEYSPLPREWRNALRNHIHQSDISDYANVALELGLDIRSVEIFDRALNKLEEWGIELNDWKDDNVMWDEEGGFPVLTDLGVH